MGDDANVVQQAYGAFAAGDIPSLLASARGGGGPGDYGAAHVFTVTGGKISRFREYTDLDAPLG